MGGVTVEGARQIGSRRLKTPLVLGDQQSGVLRMGWLRVDVGGLAADIDPQKTSCHFSFAAASRICKIRGTMVAGLVCSPSISRALS